MVLPPEQYNVKVPQITDSVKKIRGSSSCRAASENKTYVLNLLITPDQNILTLLSFFDNIPAYQEYRILDPGPKLNNDT